jgi:hypothetical protein
MEDQPSENSQIVRIAVGIVLVLAIGGGAWWYFNRPASTLEQEPMSDEGRMATLPDKAESPAIQHPLENPPATDAASAAPADPEAAVTAQLVALLGQPFVTEWVIPETLVRRLVATTDNLSRNTRIEPVRALRAPVTPLLVEREIVDASTAAEHIVLSERNFARYDAIVVVLADLDMKQAAAAYRNVYPLLQKAYEDLGYPDRYFNDRMVETIDHLLATPEPEGPITLVQPKVMYQYEDASLEQRSAGQKLLLRMGVAHARTVKQKLKELRDQIARKE